MALFKVMASKDGKTAWVAKGKNPITGRDMTLRGGEAKHRGKWGKKGGKTEGQVKSYFARHAGNKSPVAYINDKNWREGSQIGRTISIPRERFKK
jgi:hypothetical protein